MTLIKWAIIFAVLALISGALGFGVLAGVFGTVAKFLFFLFVLLVVIFIAMSLFAVKAVT